MVDLRGIEWAHLGADQLAAANVLGTLPHPERLRHLAVTASSIPPAFRAFAPNEVTGMPRAEAWLYELRKSLPRPPVYADYVVAHRDPLEEGQADQLPQNALMRYSTPADWLIARRYDINKQGSAHFPPLLRRLVVEPDVREATYSAGDRWIRAVAAGTRSPGNATIWRRAASSHHMTLVTQQIATRFAL